MSTLNMDKTAEPVADAASDRALVELSEAARTLALARWRVLRPHLEDGVPLARAARDAGVSLRTAQRWLMSLRADGLAGLAGLARRQRADRGRRRVPDELVAVIEGLALRRPAPTIATVHRRAVEVAERERWPLPSYATVYAIVRAIDSGMVTLAHEGDKRYGPPGVGKTQSARRYANWDERHPHLQRSTLVNHIAEEVDVELARSSTRRRSTTRRGLSTTTSVPSKTASAG